MGAVLGRQWLAYREGKEDGTFGSGVQAVDELACALGHNAFGSSALPHACAICSITQQPLIYGEHIIAIVVSVLFHPYWVCVHFACGDEDTVAIHAQEDVFGHVV